ncbi:response regulator [Candidatus Wolfebacteria bacterium]|nr:MAG: response regulator [Candidatus Wolfebacteria bacterium]
MKKILIVEDDSFLQGLASRKLSTQGYEILIASNSSEGFKVLEDQKPDLILLDLLLPEVDGFEFLEKIRANEAQKDIPVIVFSNLSEEKDIERAQGLGIVDYMVKASFTLDELSDKIKKYLG